MSNLLYFTRPRLSETVSLIFWFIIPSSWYSCNLLPPQQLLKGWICSAFPTIWAFFMPPTPPSHSCSIQPLRTWKLTWIKSWIHLNLGKRCCYYQLILGKFCLNEKNNSAHDILWFFKCFLPLDSHGNMWQHFYFFEFLHKTSDLQTF